MRLINDATRDKLMAIIGKRESSDNYRCVNTIGYLGRFQFGVLALIDAGLMKQGSQKGRSILSATEDGSCWVDGWSKAQFLDSPNRQDRAMRDLLSQNERTLMRLGTIGPQTSAADVCGYLMTAHLLGAGGARDLKNGIDAADAYGTKASDYFKLGVAAA